MQNPELLKLCSKCQTRLPLSAFSPDPTRKHGVRGYCKKCNAAVSYDEFHHNLEQRTKRLARVQRTRNNWLKGNPAKKKAWNAWNRHRWINRIPPWVKFADTVPFYEEALRLGPQFEVDHIVPVRSHYVCGLHCPDNLQVITKAANRLKRNYLPGKPQEILDRALKVLKARRSS